jgi:YgiT-type zinc finger domain-containing protein
MDHPDREEKAVKCSIVGCPGEYEQREVVRALQQGDQVIVVEHIPAEVCSMCGDVLFTPETIERLETIRQRVENPVGTAPIYEFARSAP